MIDTLKKFKYLIIIVVLLIVSFIAYTIYTNNGPATDSASLQRTTFGDTGTSATTLPSTGSAVPNNELAKSFVDQLLAIQSINLKVAFFADPVFVNLVDNHRGIDPQPIGRPNPFAPIGNDNGQASNKYQDINGSVINSSAQSSSVAGQNNSPVAPAKQTTSTTPSKTIKVKTPTAQ